MKKQEIITHWITAHELARLLLAGPDLPVLVPLSSIEVANKSDNDPDECCALEMVCSDHEAVYLCCEEVESPTPALAGGPFDGLQLHERTDALYLYVNADNHRVALYELNTENNRWEFTRMQRKGEGCMPDIYPETQNGRQG